MRSKIGYLLLSFWLVTLTVLLIIILSTNYSSSLVLLVYMLTLMVVLILPISAFLLKNIVFKIFSFTPLILVIVYLFVLRPHKVIGNSMSPVIKHGEYVLDNRLAYIFKKPNSGDIVIYNDGIEKIDIVTVATIDKVVIKNGIIDIKNIEGKVIYKYWPGFGKIDSSKFDLKIFDKDNNSDKSNGSQKSKSDIKCYRYNTPTSIKNNGLGIIECGIIASGQIDTTKSYCESKISKTRVYLKGFQQGNDYGYSATIDNASVDEEAEVVIYDTKGNSVSCPNKLVY